MGAIKDLVDLVTQLNASVKDRKFTNELRQVQSMIGEIQSEHAQIHEQRISLMTENAELKQTIVSLNEEINQLRNTIDTNQNLEESINLGEIEEKILTQLFYNNSRHLIEDIARLIKSDINTARYHMNTLCANKLVHQNLSLSGPSTYTISDKGIQYVAESKNT